MYKSSGCRSHKYKSSDCRNPVYDSTNSWPLIYKSSDCWVPIYKSFGCQPPIYKSFGWQTCKYRSFGSGHPICKSSGFQPLYKAGDREGAKYLGPGPVRGARNLGKTSGNGCYRQDGRRPVMCNNLLVLGQSLALASLAPIYLYKSFGCPLPLAWRSVNHNMSPWQFLSKFHNSTWNITIQVNYMTNLNLTFVNLYTTMTIIKSYV